MSGPSRLLLLALLLVTVAHAAPAAAQFIQQGNKFTNGSLAAPQYRELAEYIREVERIRHEFAGIIFLGDYFDDQLAAVTEGPRAPGAAGLQFAVHGDRATKRKAIVVVNRTKEVRRYAWRW